MRKVIAVILMIAQFAFAGYLVNRGTFLDAEKAKRIREIETFGTQYLFKLHSFSYSTDTDKPELYVNLLQEDENAYDYYVWENDYTAYSAIKTAQNGVSVLSKPSPEIPENNDYIFADTGSFMYDIDFKSIDRLLGNDSREYYNSFWTSAGKFYVNGKYRYVFAVAYVYEGELVITGLRADGQTY